MTAAQLLAGLKARSVRLSVVDGRLQVDARPGELTDADRQLLTEHKAELVAELARADATGVESRAVPIETSYAGCRFRSRLEARWAVFLDHLGVRWEYEKQGYCLPSGYYLPDFWLADFASWLEVKGEPPTDQERTLAFELARGTGHPVFIFDGGVPGFALKDVPSDSGQVFYCSPDPGGWENAHAFCVCSVCGLVGIEYLGKGRKACHNFSHQHPRIVAAVQAARSARFEHGESPRRPRPDAGWSDGEPPF